MENQNYFRGSEQVERVRAWRKANPNYWKRRMQKIAPAPLQDDCLPNDPLLVGLISFLTGSTLQEDIATTSRLLIAEGRAILSKSKSAPSEAIAKGAGDVSGK